MAGPLDPWFALHNDIATIAFATAGDSTTEGGIGTGVADNGGWVEQLRVLADARWPRGGDGMHPMNRSTWGLAGTPTKATTADAWDRSPVLGALLNAGTWRLNTATDIATWTKATASSHPPLNSNVDGFYLYMVDGASSADFSISTDGGGTWQNASAAAATTPTWSQGNTIKRVRFDIAVTGTNTVKVRGANAAGTSVKTYIMGLEPITKTPGLVVHNLGAAGEYLGNSITVRTSSGNWHEWIDTIKPKLVTLMYTNDVTLADPTTFQTQAGTFIDAVTAQGGGVLCMNMFEQDPVTRDITMQASYRAAMKAAALSRGMPCLDFYDLVPTNAAAVAAGYMNAGNNHCTNAGAIFQAQQVWKILAGSRIGTSLKAA